MKDPRTLINDILSGPLANRAQGFLIVPAQGYRLTALIEQELAAAYGTAAHPDIRRLAPEGKGGLIKVETVRDVQPFLSSTPSGAAMKTLVVYEADRLNDSAANALLKSLEEPTPHTRIVIITDRPAALPATIRSRCAVHLAAPDPEIARHETQAAAASDEAASVVPEAKINEALALAGGDPSLAGAMLAQDLVAWARKIETWLNGSDPTPPLPALAGKAAATLPAVAMTLQALLVRRCNQAVEKGQDARASSLAAWAVIEGIDDIGRAGIDAKTRLHGLLIRARAA